MRVDGQTRLVLSDLRRAAGSERWRTRARRQAVTADDLVSTALDSGAEHVLLIIDTCYAGGGAVPALGLALSRWEEESAPPGHAKWLGFLASCRSHETSDGSGPLLAALTRVLKEGPAGDAYRSAWSARNALVGGPDLLDAIATRWEGEGQTPVPATAGEWRPAFPNPLHSPGAPARLVEHLVQAARGVGHLEEGWFFTGRTRVLGRIVEWLDTDAPGLFLVTGPAGCGKSAVLGRIATLSDPEQRARAVENGALRDGDPDPGVRPERTLAAVHLRDLTPSQAAVRLARALGLPRPRGTDDFRAEVRELAPPPVLVMDGLDEVPAEHTQSMIEELVFPLSRSVPVLLGSRERVFRNRLKDNETLVQALARHIGAGVTTVDLEAEPHTREDIGEYVRRRCEAAPVAESLAREAGAAIAERATDVGGGFLFARLVTSTVLARVASGGRVAADGAARLHRRRVRERAAGGAGAGAGRRHGPSLGGLGPADRARLDGGPGDAGRRRVGGGGRGAGRGRGLRRDRRGLGAVGVRPVHRGGRGGGAGGVSPVPPGVRGLPQTAEGAGRGGGRGGVAHAGGPGEAAGAGG